MKNMKIEVNGNLDEIVVELERLKYQCDGFHPHECRFIYTFNDGTFAMYSVEFVANGYYLKTLAELKGM